MFRYYFFVLIFLRISLASSADHLTCHPPSNDWIQLKTVNDLNSIGTYGRYWLCNDIDLNGVDFRPLEVFSGQLDGNHRSIKNLKIIKPNLSSADIDNPENSNCESSWR